MAATLAGAADVGGASARVVASPLPMTSYRAQANAICAKLNRYEIPVTVAFVTGMQGALNEARQSLSALAKLQPPAALVQLHTKVLRVETKYLQYFASLIAKVRAGKLKPAEMVAMLARSPQGREAAGLWRKIGATACANG